MKIVSWNVNGIRSVYKKGFVDWLEKEAPDILCLQEIKSNEIPVVEDLFGDNFVSNYKIYINSASKKGYSGVAVFTKKQSLKITKDFGHTRFNEEGRGIKLEFEKFTLINLYIPHGARDKRNLPYKLEVYELLKKYIKSNSDKPLVVCGDFNVAKDEIDLARPKGNKNNIMFTENERLALGDFIKSGLTDSFRLLNQSGGNYSWWPYRKGLRENNIGWRIDYVFVSESMKTNIKSAFILKDVLGSDHCPVGIVLDI